MAASGPVVKPALTAKRIKLPSLVDVTSDADLVLLEPNKLRALPQDWPSEGSYQATTT